MSGLFGSAILDVAIGLIFLYLVLALAVSITSELIVQALALRATTLEQGLRRLLQGQTTAEQKRLAANVQDRVKQLYAHPLICGMSSTRGTLKPSYIPARQFALALLDIVAPAANPGGANYWAEIETAIGGIDDEHLRKALQALVRDAQGNVVAFRAGVERWYDDSMERVSGWYKRKVRVIVFLLGALFAVAVNADTLGAAETLWRDPTIRAAVVAAAQDHASQQAQAANPDLATRVGETTKAFDQGRTAGLPLGWRGWPRGWDIARAIGGLALTTLAVSLGAPFWFDTLNKIMSFRSTGKPPATGDSR